MELSTVFERETSYSKYVDIRNLSPSGRSRRLVPEVLDSVNGGGADPRERPIERCTFCLTYICKSFLFSQNI